MSEDHHLFLGFPFGVSKAAGVEKLSRIAVAPFGWDAYGQLEKSKQDMELRIWKSGAVAGSVAS